MSIFRAHSLEELSGLTTGLHQLAVLERKVPKGADIFFQKIMGRVFYIAGKVHEHSALTDLEGMLQKEMPKEVLSDPFYKYWLSDMALLCKTFCKIERSNSIGFWLGSQRGCRRYHIDNVPQRMLVTYAGQGTEWIPDEAADRNAFASGKPNENIIKDLSKRRFINPWDVSLFYGGPKGLLHRTPDSAFNGKSILMRLDSASFWESVLKNHNS